MCRSVDACLTDLTALLVRCSPRHTLLYVPTREVAAGVAKEVGAAGTQANVSCPTCELYVAKSVTAFVLAWADARAMHVDGLVTPDGSFTPLSDGDTACGFSPLAPLDEPGLGVGPGGRRCLPAVAAACGCVYPCTVGSRRLDDGAYDVQLSGFPEPVTGRVKRWCVGKACTDAFFVELLCTAVCSPKPADATCHFDATGACGGAP